MSWRRIRIAGLLLLVGGAGVLLHYTLPRTEVVQVTGTDVKRTDATGKARKSAGNEAAVLVRDIRFINTVGKDGRPRVYRNEDTGWGWPPYFKFNSADLTALAQTYATAPEKPWVLVRHYGWRIRFLNAFPNAVGLRQVSKEYQHVPWFNAVILLFLLAGGWYALLRLRRLKQRVSERWVKRREGNTPV